MPSPVLLAFCGEGRLGCSTAVYTVGHQRALPLVVAPGRGQRISIWDSGTEMQAEVPGVWRTAAPGDTGSPHSMGN